MTNQNNTLTRYKLAHMSRAAIVTATLGGTLALASVAQAAPAGMAYHLTGKPQARTGGNWGTLRVLQKLEPGDAVRCGAGDSAVIVMFRNGERFQVGAGVTGTIQADKVAGAQSLGKLRGPSARVASTLTGSRTGAIMARPGTAPVSLTPQAPGWIKDSERVLAWTPVESASSYSFVLFDRYSAVLSGRVSEPRVQLPTTLTLSPRTPYVWRMVPFGRSGKALQTGDRWGVVTFLNATDAARLSSDVAQLNEGMKQQGSDEAIAAAAILAELYGEYGVLQKTIELLENKPLQGMAGTQEARDEAYAQLGYYGTMFGIAHNPSPPPADAGVR